MPARAVPATLEAARCYINRLQRGCPRPLFALRAGNIAPRSPIARSGTGAPASHDHPIAARHRPLQVHDDAGRPASLSGRARRVPIQVPQPRRRPDALHRRDPRRDSRALQPALRPRRAHLSARMAVLQERFRRSSGPLPARRALHPRRSLPKAPTARSTSRSGDRGSTRSCSRSRCSRSSPRCTTATSIRGRSSARVGGGSREKIERMNGVADPEFRIADYGTRRRFSRDVARRGAAHAAAGSGRSSSARATSASRWRSD